MRHRAPLTSLLLLLVFSSLCARTCAKRVAVIGAGIAGASTAYYTYKYAGADVEIHVYEKTDRIGGRMKHVEIGGEVCEVGADAWSSVNEYLMSLMKELDVPMDNSSYDGNGEIGFYEGGGSWNSPKKDVVSEAMLYTQIELYRYHLHANYAERANTPFQTVEDFAKYGDMNTYTSISMAEFGSKHDVKEAFLWNEVLPVIRGIYDQDLNVSAFAGIVSLLPALTDAYGVLGGNSIIVEMLLNSSLASVNLNTPINEISQVGGSYQLSSDQGPIPLLFDDVVIANPFEFSNISFSNITTQTITPRPFVHWYVTLILAKALNPSYFGNPAKMPDNVFTTGNTTAPFVVVYPIAKSQSGLVVFKIFANNDVTEYLDDIFVGVADHYVQVWPYTFPDLSPQKSYQPVILAPHLYYTSGIESIATAMECSTIAGRNAALLIAQQK